MVPVTSPASANWQSTTSEPALNVQRIVIILLVLELRCWLARELPELVMGCRPTMLPTCIGSIQATRTMLERSIGHGVSVW